MKKFTLWLFSFFGFFLILSVLAAISLPDGKLLALDKDSGNSNYSFVISHIAPMHSIFTSQIFHSSFNEFLANAFVLCLLFAVFFYFRDILSKIFHSVYLFLAVFALPFLFANLVLWLLFHLVGDCDIVGMSILNFSLIGVFFAFSLFCITNKINLKIVLPVLFVLLAYVCYSLGTFPVFLTNLAHSLGLAYGFIFGCFLFKTDLLLSLKNLIFGYGSR